MTPWLLLAAAVISALAHICVLPATGALAAPEPLSGEARPHHDHGPSSDDRGHHGDGAHEGVHVASCDGIRVGVPDATAVLASARCPVAPRVDQPAGSSVALLRPTFLAPSPPLFIRHASLLI